MATEPVHDQKVEQGHNRRYELASGETLTLDLRRYGSQRGTLRVRAEPFSIMEAGIDWLVRAAGAVTIEIAFDTDLDEWIAHGTHGTVAAGANTGYRETARLAGLRFTPSGGAAKVSLWSAAPLDAGVA